MAYREVTMLELKEVLRLWLARAGKKPIAAQLGLDVKTVRRYLRAAEECGLKPGPQLLTDERLARSLAGWGPRRGGHMERRGSCACASASSSRSTWRSTSSSARCRDCWRAEASRCRTRRCTDSPSPSWSSDGRRRRCRSLTASPARRCGSTLAG